MARPCVAEIRDYGVTVRVAAGLVTPEALAKMLTVPGATPVVSPLPSMVAVPEKLQAQVNVTPATALPLASTAAAVNCFVPFTAIVAVGGEMVMDAMDCVTGSVAGALVTPDAEAVI